MEKWCTIESDPGVFTALIEEFGVKNVQVEELCTLNYDEISRAGSVYGLIFMFKWAAEETANLVIDMPDMFFARQVVHNACATQAILSVLMNSNVELGQQLSDFKDFVMEFSPDNKGIAIGNSDLIRKTHNSFSMSKYDNDDDDDDDSDSRKRKRGEAFHFVAYIPYNGYIYELDGLKTGPILLGEYDESNGESQWLSSVLPMIRERVDRNRTLSMVEDSGSEDELRFNLLAIIPDKRIELNRQKEEIEGKMHECSDEEGLMLSSSLSAVEELITEEERTRSVWKEENDRRRFDYTPLLICLLSCLSESKKLESVTAQARERTRNRAQNQRTKSLNSQKK